MEIQSTLINSVGEVLPTEYKDISYFKEYEGIPIQGVHAYSFCGDKMVIVYSPKKGFWTPPGGGVEKDESVEEAAVREVLEETNMRVLAQAPIGLFKIYEKNRQVYQARTMCIVEPVGPFLADPDEDITEIRLIDPEKVTDYFNWGETGAWQMKRGLELYEQMK